MKLIFGASSLEGTAELEEQRRINTEQEEGNEDGIRNGIYNIPKNGNESTKNDSENAQEQIVVPEVDNTIKNEPILTKLFPSIFKYCFVI